MNKPKLYRWDTINYMSTAASAQGWCRIHWLAPPLWLVGRSGRSLAFGHKRLAKSHSDFWRALPSFLRPISSQVQAAFGVCIKSWSSKPWLAWKKDADSGVYTVWSGRVSPTSSSFVLHHQAAMFDRVKITLKLIHSASSAASLIARLDLALPSNWWRASLVGGAYMHPWYQLESLCLLRLQTLYHHCKQ